MPVSRERFRESLAEYLDAEAAERREAAKRATSDDESRRLNRGSADLDQLAKRLREQEDQANVDLANLHAWEDAQDRVGPYRWEPNDAQADAIRRYADDPSGGPDALLAELNNVR